MKTLATATLVAASFLGCSNGTSTNSASLVVHPNVRGTVFTIVFENEDASNVISPNNPFFAELASKYGRAVNYKSSTHPSCPNYILMTSGSTNGVTNDNDPNQNVRVPGSANLMAQLDAKGVMWRAYMESMGAPCQMQSSGNYCAHHDPFLYYSYVAGDPASCNQHVVDYDQNFTADLQSGLYKYMWITPNMCDDMHNCSAQIADAWLQKTVTTIMASPAYTNGGAIFILFDEGSSRAPGATAPLLTLVISPNLTSAPFQTSTPFDHRSYLATIEDIFDLERLPTTKDATSLDEFFQVLNDSTDAGAARFSD